MDSDLKRQLQSQPFVTQRALPVLEGLMSQQDLQKLIHAFSQIDYYNSVFSGLPTNTAVLTKTRKIEHIPPLHFWS